MRAAANGKSREEGFAAMEVEARWLRECKPKPQGGCVKEQEGTYRVVIRWLDGGLEREVDGPRRAEKRHALDDLDFMQEASYRHEEVLAGRTIMGRQQNA